MKESVLERLGELADASSDLDAEFAFMNWSARAYAFLRVAVGEDAAATFAGLRGPNWVETAALMRGHLEGLAAASSAASEKQAEIEDARTTKTRHESDSRSVFVVHGHDEAAKDSVARFLEKLGLETVVLHEQPNAGRTIIEKFETYSGDVAFAVVLLTPDDVGCEGNDASRLRPRARQNVILELGYFIGRLGRTRVCALHKGDIEFPSDYQGVLYVPLDDQGAWRAKLAQELVQAKVSIALQALLGAG